MLMGVVSKRRLADYWEEDTLTQTPFFGTAMPRNRFQFIMSSLHFFDTSDITNDPNICKDKMRRIRLVFDTLRLQFGAVFHPYKNLVIDESLVLWRGKLSFQMYIPSKRHRFGLKIFVLCDCKTGFVVDILLYTGSDTEYEEDKELGVAGSIVTELMEPYLTHGHVLYCDNWYTSPILAKYLYSYKTGICGTVKKNRKYMPKPAEPLKKKDIEFFTTNNILCTAWMDKCEVFLLSTVHKPLVHKSKSFDYSDGVKKHIWKPECVMDYNINMRLVDKSDAMISAIDCARKTMKWYKRLFFHLLDIVVLNSHILHCEVTGKKETLAEFVKELCRELLREHGCYRGSRSATSESHLRLTGRHNLIPLVEIVESSKPRRCHLCYNNVNASARKQTRTSYSCEQCNKPFCIYPCFKIYHNQKNACKCCK